MVCIYTKRYQPVVPNADIMCLLACANQNYIGTLQFRLHVPNNLKYNIFVLTQIHALYLCVHESNYLLIRV